jgi:hypothetical protein
VATFAPAAGARTLTPFVGREEELALLAGRWDSVRAGEGQLVVIVGEPGLGKSRLIEEFHARLAETPLTWVEWSAPNVAARVEAAAELGSVLVTMNVQRQIAGLFVVEEQGQRSSEA